MSAMQHWLKGMVRIVNKPKINMSQAVRYGDVDTIDDYRSIRVGHDRLNYAIFNNLE